MTGHESSTITKKELVHRIADATGQTKVVVKDVVQLFLDEIVNELVAGNRLEFREFGVFEIRQRASRVAQNPRTLEKVEVPAKRVVKFKAGRLMRQRLGDESDEDFDDERDDDAAPRRAGRVPGSDPRAGARGGARPSSAPAASAPPPPPPAPVRPPPKPPSNSPF